MESSCVREKMDGVYRSFIVNFANNLRVSDIEIFRYWCKITLSESQLEGRSVLDIVRGLERADKLSYRNLGFLKDFLKKRILQITLYNELLQAEAEINYLQTMMEYTHLESKHQAYKLNSRFRVAEVLLKMNERNDKLSQVINTRTTTSEVYREIETLSKEMSLLDKEDVTWEKVQLLFASCCKLDAAVHDSPDFNEKWRSEELRRLLSSLIVCLGGWDDFVHNVQSSEATEPDSAMRKELLDAVYYNSKCSDGKPTKEFF